MRIFFGITSSRIGEVRRKRRQRLRKAYGDSALGVPLTDDIAVEFGDNFARREIRHEAQRLSTIKLKLV